MKRLYIYRHIKRYIAIALMATLIFGKIDVLATENGTDGTETVSVDGTPDNAGIVDAGIADTGTGENVAASSDAQGSTDVSTDGTADVNSETDVSQAQSTDESETGSGSQENSSQDQADAEADQTGETVESNTEGAIRPVLQQTPAIEGDALSEPEAIAVETDAPETDIYSVILPVVEDKDPFNFFIDPKNILYNSFKDSDEVTVEEGANLLFINRTEEKVGLSGNSDKLSIINQSTMPVDVTITATIENIEGINLVQTEDFGDSEECDLYLALTDENGNEIPLSKEGEVTLTVRLDKAPIEAYAYVLDEESGEYRYAYQMLEDIVFSSYSVGIKGSANKEGDWTIPTGKPKVQVSWHVEPVKEEDSEDSNEPAEDAQNEE